MANTDRQIDRERGCHLLVYAGGGGEGRVELFSTASADESYAICDLLQRLLDRRCPSAMSTSDSVVPHMTFASEDADEGGT